MGQDEEQFKDVNARMYQTTAHAQRLQLLRQTHQWQRLQEVRPQCSIAQCMMISTLSYSAYPAVSTVAGRAEPLQEDGLRDPVSRESTAGICSRG